MLTRPNPNPDPNPNPHQAMAKFAADTPGKTVQELCEADIAEVLPLTL